MTLSRVKRACDEGSLQMARKLDSKCRDKMEFCRQIIKGEMRNKRRVKSKEDPKASQGCPVWMVNAVRGAAHRKCKCWVVEEGRAG